MDKRILIDQLTPGMYLTGMDQSWWRTPFFFHQRLLKRAEEIDMLKQLGVREVTIDPIRGADVDKPSLTPSPEQTAAVSPDQPGALPPLPGDPRELGRQELEALLRDPASFPHKADLLRFAQHYHAPVNAAATREVIIQQCLRMIHDVRTGEEALHTLTRELPTARSVRAAALANVQRIFEGVKTGAPIDSPAVLSTVRALLDTMLRCQEASLLLVQLQQFDTDLFTHAVDVCVLALVVGKGQALPQQRLVALGMGALLHDIGQMRLPQNLVRKPGLYTDQERQLMQAHPQLGVALLAQTKAIPAEARRIVAEHHERADGSGYPGGLIGADIAALSEIVSIIDVYDTMLSSRGGHPPLPPTHVLKHLYQLGAAGQMNREQVEQIIHTFTVYPVGSLVELTTGEWGLVIATTPADPLRPIVTLVRDSAGRPYKERQVLDLSARGVGRPTQAILRVLNPADEGIALADYLNERS